MKCIFTQRGIYINYEEFVKKLGRRMSRKFLKKITIETKIILGRGRSYTKEARLYKFIQSKNRETYLLVPRHIGLKLQEKNVIRIKNKIKPGETIDIRRFFSGINEKHGTLKELAFSEYSKNVDDINLMNKAVTGVESIANNIYKREIIKNNGIRLYESQDAIRKYFVNKIFSQEKQEEGSAGAVLIMDTGRGKTFVAIKILEYLARKTLIVCPNEILLNQWDDVLTKFYPQLRVGKYYGQKKIDGDVILIIINSALSEEFIVKTSVKRDAARTRKKGSIGLAPGEYFGQFGFIIFDEIHKYVSDKFQQVFWRANAQCVLGLTATPDERIDKFDNVYKKHVGPLIFAKDIPGFNVKDVVFKGEVKVVRYVGPPEYTREIRMNGLPSSPISIPKMVNQFIEDPYRNVLIVREIKELFRQGKYTFVFSDRRGHLEKIRKLLAEEGLRAFMPESKKAMTLMGGSDRDEVSLAAKKAHVILTTYGYSSVGLSINKMNAIIFSTSRRNNMKQILGRILRLHGDTSIKRKIIDIVDWGLL